MRIVMKLSLSQSVVKGVMLAGLCVADSANADVTLVGSYDIIVKGDGFENHIFKTNENASDSKPDFKFTAIDTSISAFHDGNNQLLNAGDRVLTFSRANVANGVSVHTQGAALIISDGSYIGSGNIGYYDNDLSAVSVGGFHNGVIPDKSVKAIIRDSTLEKKNLSSLFYGNSALNANLRSDVSVENSKLVSTVGAGIYAYMPERVFVKDSQIFSKDASLRVAISDMMNTPGTYILDNSVLSSSDSAAIAIDRHSDSDDLQKNDFLIINGTILKGKDNNLIDISGTIDADVIVSNTRLAGDINMDNSAGGQARLRLENNAFVTGQLRGLQSVVLKSGGTWEMTEDSMQQSLVMKNGAVIFGDVNSDFKTLHVKTLSGNGEFYMHTNISHRNGDFLNVTDNADGDFLISVANSGVEPAAKDTDSLKLVHIADGNASFSLKNNYADIGVWQYALKKQGNSWYLSPDRLKGEDDDKEEEDHKEEEGNKEEEDDKSDRQTSSSTDAIMSMAGVPREIFTGEMNTLFGHRQEYSDQQSSGNRAWGQFLSSDSKQKVGWGAQHDFSQKGIIIGAEKELETTLSKTLTGVFGVHSSNDVRHVRGGKSHTESWGAGIYSRFGTDNSYMDVVLKANLLSNKLHTNMTGGEAVNGSFKQKGYGMAAESGKKFTWNESLWITPYIRVTWFQADGAKLKLDNGMQADISGIRSLQGEAGLRAGKSLSGRPDVMPYLTLGTIQEFITSNSVKINNYQFNNDLSGSRIRSGMGINTKINNDLNVDAEINYVKGNKISSLVTGIIGISYSF